MKKIKIPQTLEMQFMPIQCLLITQWKFHWHALQVDQSASMPQPSISIKVKVTNLIMGLKVEAICIEYGGGVTKRC